MKQEVIEKYNAVTPASEEDFARARAGGFSWLWFMNRARGRGDVYFWNLIHAQARNWEGWSSCNSKSREEISETALKKERNCCFGKGADHDVGHRAPDGLLRTLGLSTSPLPTSESASSE